MERGILGVKKDPKNPMLFSFSGGDGWPSSDSEDSDYTPDIASVKPRKRRGVAKTSDSEDSDYTPEATSVKPRKRRGIGLVKTSDSEDSDYAPEATSIKPRKRRGESNGSRRSSPRKAQDAKKRKTGRPTEAPSGNDDPSCLIVNANCTLPSNRHASDIVVATVPRASEPDLLKLKICKKRTSIKEIDTTVAEDLDRWGRLLPSFILLKIFKTIVDADGPLPTLCRYDPLSHLFSY